MQYALKYNFLLTCAGGTPQTLRLKVCLHLNQPGWERTELVVANDDTDCLKIIGEVEEKLRRYSKDGLVSKSSKPTGSRAVLIAPSLWYTNSLLCTGSIVVEALIMMRMITITISGINKLAPDDSFEVQILVVIQ